MSDVYGSALSRILLATEKVYGIDSIDPDSTMTTLELKSRIETELKSMSREQVIKRNRLAGEHIMPLPFITMKMKFFGYIRLIYVDYPGLHQTVSVLLRFTNKDTITVEAYKDLNKIIILLNEIDKKQIQLKSHLAYRYLRMFVILLLNNNTFCASIFADLILNQIVVKEATKC